VLQRRFKKIFHKDKISLFSEWIGGKESKNSGTDFLY
jgi:hypothetical protein